MGISFYESNLEVILVPYNNPVVITVIMGEFRTILLLVDEGSALSLLYLNYKTRMELKDEFIIKEVGEVAGFNSFTSKPYVKIMLDITVHNKAISIKFNLMNYNAPHNGLLGYD